MNYKVFKIDNPDTWPELNCPLLVWKPNEEWPHIFQWDFNAHCFLNDCDTYYPNKCLYKYIGYMPYIKNALHPIKCAFNNWECPHYDDGYCLCTENCEYQKEVTEYEFGSKPIWKEY